MFKSLKELFSPQSGSENEDSQNPLERLKVATCVLLLEIARADDEFCDEERRHIIETLKSRFSLGESDAHELIELATEARDQSRDLWSFTSQINQACSMDEKLGVIREVWQVVFADGSMDGHENYLAHQMGKLMNLTHGQIIEAKVEVLEELRG